MHRDEMRRAAQIIAARVRAVAPDAMPWAFAMARVGSTESPLVQALLDYGATGSAEAQAAVFDAAQAWIAAWKRAGLDWERNAQGVEDPAA